MAANPEAKPEPQSRLIKKYPNRRLYDTKTSSYITLADVKQMVLKQEETASTSYPLEGKGRGNTAS